MNPLSAAELDAVARRLRDVAVGVLSELSEGDRVTFDITDSERGPQARNVQLVRGSAQRGAPAASARGRSAHPTASAPTRASDGPVRGGEGVVTRYDAERGFGFIAPDAGGADLFVHVSVVGGADALQEGDRVRYKVRQSDRGPQADSVELV